jgi:hypothetical protein
MANEKTLHAEGLERNGLAKGLDQQATLPLRSRRQAQVRMEAVIVG